MKLILVILLLVFCKIVAGQDTNMIYKLKPIVNLEIKLSDTKNIIERQNIDSLNNTFECKKKIEEYKKLCLVSMRKLSEVKENVKQLNEENKHSCYYYFLVYDCKNDFKFEGCGSYINSSSDCPEIEIKIEKKEKTRIIFDGPSGDVFYYEDINKLPK
jgi:hypothetical protein